MKKVKLFLVFAVLAIGASAQTVPTIGNYDDDQPAKVDAYQNPFESGSATQNTTTSSTSSFYYSRIHCSVCGYWHYAPSCTPTPKPAPIDGGVSLLLIAGVAYGTRRKRKAKNNQCA